MPTTKTRTFLAFNVLGVRLGLEATCVKEVLPSMQLLTPPEMPPLLRGFLRLRGHLIPVIRLELLAQGSSRSEAVPAPLQLTDRILVARLDELEVAWVTSADMEPLTFTLADTEPLPGDHLLNNCAQAILPHTPPVVLLDPAKLLLTTEKQRLRELQEMAARRLALTHLPATEESSHA